MNNTYVKTTGPGNTQRWIIGLPSVTYNHQPNNAAGSSFTTLSKVTYQYDQSGYLEHQLPSAGTITNHDTANFGISFLSGRGNLTSVTRWDATDENNSAKAITSYTKYNTSGSPITQYLPDNNLSGRTTNISYQDAWSDSTANNTLAYPTTVTDPDTNSSTLRYRYDIGAVTRTQDPKMLAADPSKGIVTTYDALGRPTIVDNQFSTARSLHYYDTALHWQITYIKADEAGNYHYTARYFDGHGRQYAVASPHPNSVGGNRFQAYYYDAMGRLVHWLNPTEINIYYLPSGDDQASGWIGSTQSYDWKGRPLVTTNQDGTTKSYNYGGCGCTGEATVTVTDEVGRKTRTISDAFLDHTMQVDKTEVLNMDGTTVYSTTARVTKPLERKSYVRQFVGTTTNYTTCPTNNCREAETTYDGLGRAISSHRPIEIGSSTYEYYADGSLKKWIDPRGAYATNSYNKRGLVTNIDYEAAGGAIATSDVSFTYDINGNRETMTDGVGSVTYSYDTLSRLNSEARYFSEINQTKTIGYEYYSSTGQLKKITDPAGDSVSYDYDLAGRLNSVTGSSFGSVTQYTSSSSGIKYRAWDAVKQMTYGNNFKIESAYDSRQRLTSFKLNNQNNVAVMHTTQEFYADSTSFYTKDLLDSRFDRAYDFDQAGRLEYGTSGWEARYFASRPRPDNNEAEGPYTLGYIRDPWNELTSRVGWYWDTDNNYTRNFDAATGRNPSWQYNNAGQMTQDASSTYAYDVTGQNQQTSSLDGNRIVTNALDGEGKVAKQAQTVTAFGVTTTTTKFYVYSSVLGGRLLTELAGSTGNKAVTFVYGAGTLLAEQQALTGLVIWNHQNPISGVKAETNQAQVYTPRFNPDPTGVQVGFENPYPPPRPPQSQFTGKGQFGLKVNNGDCTLDGVYYPCDMVSRVAGEAAVYAPEDQVRFVQVGVFEKERPDGGIDYSPVYASAFFRAFADGYAGYLPTGASYKGKGSWNWSDPARYHGGYGRGGEYDGEIKRDNPVRIDHLVSSNYGSPNPKTDSSKKAVTVWEILHSFVNNQECVDAFNALEADGKKGVDIVGLLGKNFVRIGTNEYIGETSNVGLQEKLGVNEAGVAYFRNNLRGQAITDSYMSHFNNGAVTPVIILNSSLFNSKGPVLAQVLAHELIHAGGFHAKDPTRFSFFGRGTGPNDPNDLDYLGEKYSQVIDKCVKGVPERLK